MNRKKERWYTARKTGACAAKHKKRRGAPLTAITNFALAFLLLSVGSVCLYDTGGEVFAASDENLYRYGTKGSDCVSLMFNVYENTAVVYEILNVLEESGAKATFFVGGCWADDNEACLNAIRNGGHETGNHGYFHKDHSALSLRENEAEIEKCNRIVEAFTGVKPTLFAPPSGAYGKNTLIAAASAEMKTILWTKDTIDWRDRNASLIYRRATENIEGGDFILMHPKEETVAALKDILSYYKNHSLRAVTVSENLAAGG